MTWILLLFSLNILSSLLTNDFDSKLSFDNAVVGEWSPDNSSGGDGENGSNLWADFDGKFNFNWWHLGVGNEQKGFCSNDDGTGGADIDSSDWLPKILSLYNCFSYSNNWPKKLKFGEIVALFDLTYLKNKFDND